MEKLPFEQGKFYWCHSSNNRTGSCVFELGKKYLCVEACDTRFSRKLSDDHSQVKFKSEDGLITSFFGCHAVSYFTDDVKKGLGTCKLLVC